MAKRGWKKSERDELIACVKRAFENNTSLKAVFSDFAKKHDRKRDSVRNFYYLVVADANLRGEEIQGIKKNDIETFGKKELETLVRKIMDKLSRGSSLRGAIMSITKNQTKALRYQNKFRNLIKSKSPVIDKIMNEQKLNGRYYDPYRKLVVAIEPAIKVLHKDKADELLSSISDKIDNLNVEKQTAKSKSIKLA
ncbi:MAG: hypothetical protein RR458_01550 [Clostridia bacterium]